LSAKKKANADTPLGSMQMLKAATKVGLGCGYDDAEFGAQYVLKHLS
jgi:hypothetical protein